jgi:cell wall-associated NlpC family hydrolase
MKSSSLEKHDNLFRILLLLFLSISIFSSCASNKKSTDKTVDQVINTARSYRGTPYRYGGTTRSGMDCSALIYHSFSSIGLQMPRTSEAQSKLGKNIPEKNLQKGDLLFFATSKSKKKVTHSGLVTEVSGRGIYFIHSSTSLGVTEDNLNNSYWRKTFLFGRRILDKD